MIEFETTGLKELQRAIDKGTQVPDPVLKEMVSAKAKVVEKAQIFEAGTMLTGPYYQGDVAASVKAKKPRKSGGTYSVDIKFDGESHGNRNAEIAFVNEFGKKSQPARPFIRTAIEESEAEATKAAEKPFDKWLRSTGLI